MEAPFKSISMKQVEEAFASALCALTSSEAKVAINFVMDVSDGANNLIGQERWMLGLVPTIASSPATAMVRPRHSDPARPDGQS